LPSLYHRLAAPRRLPEMVCNAIMC
jgi:hypothetical protein